MLNMKKKNDILKQDKRRFKPLIAASLAIALGVSVASADFTAGNAVDRNVTIEEGEATIGTTTPITSNKGVAGIAVIPTNTATVTLNADVTIGTIANDTENKNAYGIFVNDTTATTNDVSFTGNHTITIAAPTVVTGTGKAYIYANEGASTISFTGGARIIAGTLSDSGVSTSFGIYSNLDGANYEFGSSTGKTIFDGGTANSGNGVLTQV